MQRSLVLVIVLAASGCAELPQSDFVAAPAPPRHDALYTPERVKPGRLEYAPDRDTFAPVLTQKFTYPTQQQANNAWLRAKSSGDGGIHIIKGVDALSLNQQEAAAARIAVFACKPGALDEQTGRIQRFDGPVVHCATDFIGDGGKAFRRETINFYHYQGAWHLQQTSPPTTPVHWRNPESSPTDRWSWVPGRDRYQ